MTQLILAYNFPAKHLSEAPHGCNEAGRTGPAG